MLTQKLLLSWAVDSFNYNTQTVYHSGATFILE